MLMHVRVSVSQFNKLWYQMIISQAGSTSRRHSLSRIPIQDLMAKQEERFPRTKSHPNRVKRCSRTRPWRSWRRNSTRLSQRGVHWDCTTERSPAIISIGRGRKRRMKRSRGVAFAWKISRERRCLSHPANTCFMKDALFLGWTTMTVVQSADSGLFPPWMMISCILEVVKPKAETEYKFIGFLVIVDML